MNFKNKISKIGLALATVGVITTSFSSVALAATLQTIRTGTFDNSARIVLNFDELPSYSISVEDNIISLDFKGTIDPKSLEKIILKDDDVQDLGMTKIGDNENVFTITYDKPVTGYRVFSLKNPSRIVIDKGAEIKVVPNKNQTKKVVTTQNKTNEAIKEKASNPVATEPVKPVSSVKKEENNSINKANKANIVIPKEETKVIDTPNGKVTLHRLGDNNANSVKSESTKVSPSSN